MTWKSGCRHLANTVKSPAAQIVAIFKRGVVVFKEQGKKASICPYAQWFWFGRSHDGGNSGKLSTTGSDS